MNVYTLRFRSTRTTELWRCRYGHRWHKRWWITSRKLV